MEETNNEAKRLTVTLPLDLSLLVREQANKDERSFNKEVAWIVRQFLTAKDGQKKG
jgi:hypothetical protein